MNNTLGASRNRQLYANKELVMAEDGFHGTNPHWTTLRVTTFECSLGARAVSVCCDTAQAFVFRAGVSVLWHSPSLGVRAVSVCCDTAQAMVFVLRQCVVTQPKPWWSCWCQCVVTQPKPWCSCWCQCVVTQHKPRQSESASVSCFLEAIWPLRYLILSFSHIPLSDSLPF